MKRTRIVIQHSQHKFHDSLYANRFAIKRVIVFFNYTLECYCTHSQYSFPAYSGNCRSVVVEVAEDRQGLQESMADHLPIPVQPAGEHNNRLSLHSLAIISKHGQ